MQILRSIFPISKVIKGIYQKETQHSYLPLMVWNINRLFPDALRKEAAYTSRYISTFIEITSCVQLTF
jgi:hypothetical protein